jgi:hypothetical protein
VLTGGTVATGALDDLGQARDADRVDVDAAWGGPLRFSPRYAELLRDVTLADSVGFSAHKWCFQPKGTAIVLFKDAEAAHESLSYGATTPSSVYSACLERWIEISPVEKFPLELKPRVAGHSSCYCRFVAVSATLRISPKQGRGIKISTGDAQFSVAGPVIQGPVRNCSISGVR